jgi:hypothetical protein
VERREEMRGEAWRRRPAEQQRAAGQGQGRIAQIQSIHPDERRAEERRGEERRSCK